MENFPERLEVDTQECFMKDSYDFYYSSPVYGIVPCKHSNKKNYQCCSKEANYVVVECIHKNGEIRSHNIILKTEGTGILYPLYFPHFRLIL